jgi:hypothetical protein
MDELLGCLPPPLIDYEVTDMGIWESTLYEVATAFFLIDYFWVGI